MLATTAVCAGYLLHLLATMGLVAAIAPLVRDEPLPKAELRMIDFTTKRVLTFDCYGTLIDWETGILSTLQPILTDHGVTGDPEHLLTLYGEVESATEQRPYVPYRQLVMAVLLGLGERLGFSPSEAEQSRFAHAVGDWRPFADTPAATARPDLEVPDLAALVRMSGVA